MKKLRQLERHNRMLKMMNTIVAGVTQSIDLHQLLDNTLTTILEVMNFSAGKILIYDHATRTVTLSAVKGKAAGVVVIGESYPLMLPPMYSDWVLQTGKPLIINDSWNIPDYVRKAVNVDDMKRLPRHSYAILPLLSGDEVIGVLNVAYDHYAPFDDEEFWLFKSTADHLAVALANAKLYDQLHHAHQKLRELDRLKSNFFANISHELRTPLTSILGYTRLFADGELGDLNMDQQEAINVIEKQSHHLFIMINNLLDSARLGVGQMVLNRTTFSLKEVVSQVIMNLHPLADEKGLRLIDTIPEMLPGVLGDKERVGQILTNLITNAIKFTSTGSITLFAVPNREWLRVDVSDTGIGIPADALPNIFERFYQVNGNHTRPVEGTGLGLSIVKELVELHEGSVTAESTIGVGTTFRFTLPISKPEL